jgi:hypothetical protein
MLTNIYRQRALKLSGFSGRSTASQHNTLNYLIDERLESQNLRPLMVVAKNNERIQMENRMHWL